MRTDSITLCCIVPNRNLQGLPKHPSGHPRVSEQNLLPHNMAWRTREASRPPGGPTLEGPRIRPHQDFPARSRPHQAPHHRRKEGGGFPPTRARPFGGGGGGRGVRDHVFFICVCEAIYLALYIHMYICMSVYTYARTSFMLCVCTYNSL